MPSIAESHVPHPFCSILQDLTTTSRWCPRKARWLLCGIERILFHLASHRCACPPPWSRACHVPLQKSMSNGSSCSRGLAATAAELPRVAETLRTAWAVFLHIRRAHSERHESWHRVSCTPLARAPFITNTAWVLQCTYLRPAADPPSTRNRASGATWDGAGTTQAAGIGAAAEKAYLGLDVFTRHGPSTRPGRARTHGPSAWLPH